MLLRTVFWFRRRENDGEACDENRPILPKDDVKRNVDEDNSAMVGVSEAEQHEHHPLAIVVTAPENNSPGSDNAADHEQDRTLLNKYMFVCLLIVYCLFIVSW
jgi:hypothetical protein